MNARMFFMHNSMLHHVSILTAQLAHSVAFYRNVIGLQQIDRRPPIPVPAAWFTGGGEWQLRVLDYPAGTFRQKPGIDTGDRHFAIRVENLAAVEINGAA